MLRMLKIGQTTSIAPPMDTAKSGPAAGVDLGAMAGGGNRINMGQLAKRLGKPPQAPAGPVLAKR